MITSICWILLITLFMVFGDPKKMSKSNKLMCMVLVLVATISSIIDVLTPIIGGLS